MFQEPNQTAYDLHFAIFGVPVRIHPLFWFVTAILAISGQGNDDRIDGPQVILWIIAAFVSILLHEFGHVLAMRWFGWRSRVVLHSMGGLAIQDDNSWDSYSSSRNQRTPAQQLVVSFAGPLAGFLLAGLILLICWGLRHPIHFYLGGPLLFDNTLPGFANARIDVLVDYLLFINIFWGLLNLLPIFPLDGGQMFQAAYTYFREHEAQRAALLVSVATAAAVAIYGLLRLHSLYMALMFGMLAYFNYAQWKQLSDGWRDESRW